MQLTHRFTVPASKDTTWAAFDDIESVAECFPGALVTSVEGDTFEGTVKVKLGPIALVYKGTGTFTEKDEASGRMLIVAKGKDKRGNGTAGADVVATLTPHGDSCDVEVVTDLAITGKPAQFGRGVIQDVSDKLLGQFVTCLESKVGSGAGERPPASAPTAPARPATEDDGSPAARSAGGTGPGTDAGPSAVPGPSVVPAPGQASAPASPAPAGSPSPAPSASRSEPAPQQDDAIDLGATVLPILAKAYWKQALAAVVVIAVIVWLLVR
ncbi:hypothetical protein GCM10011519_29640 [Marmoricola endophyticus]|uniref:Carbon monoxide dehydrogenase n=1 Tax=Marmoricola endophyticus TaxID=2040280 RepID=A0A917BR45_9ACTN|nr:SRPBCC family protein [Marmoricola endophyticus]GGF53805.1 hypothetical protein GCM10011519_29640 [Marmoricola endophyticus]